MEKIKTYDNELYCANCGRQIEAGEEYWRCLETIYRLSILIVMIVIFFAVEIVFAKVYF